LVRYLPLGTIDMAFGVLAGDWLALLARFSAQAERASSDRQTNCSLNCWAL
jgi:hypothetical protein